MSYLPKAYRELGGNTFVVLGRNGGVFKGQTSAAATPAQAANIAAIAATGTFSAGIAAKIEAMRVALIGVGILATS